MGCKVSANTDASSVLTLEVLWMSFATNPTTDPVGNGLKWPRYKPGENTMAIFADDTWVQFGSESLVDNLCEV